jgi:tetratricopeptide (TPR) repeat protein
MAIRGFLNSADNTDLMFVNANLLGFAVLGIIITCVVWWDRCSVALLWASAAAAAGFIVGFIFGFPRTIAQPLTPDAPPATSAVPAPDAPNGPHQTARAARLSVNTNLEQVSDWITKTIVALGLVQLRQLPRYFAQIASYAGRATGRPYTGASAQEAAAALLGYFTVLGFLAGYLLTRMFFQGAFTRGDRGLEQAADVMKNTLVANSIGAPEKTATVSPQVTAAAEKLKDLSPFTANAYGISAADIARANLFSGDTKQAVEAYRSAIARDPSNPRLRFEFARALQSVGAPGTEVEVMAALRDARAMEPQKPDPDLRRKIYESLTYLALYQPEPDGFTQAIFFGTAYTAEPTNLPSAVIFVNLAAAYGQQARWTKTHDGQLDVTVRARALDAARFAIRLDPAEKGFLASLLKGDRPGEDDLAVFKDDNEFRELLGLPRLNG